MTIDLHAHYFDGAKYLDRLLAAMDAAGIETACLSAFGPWFGWTRGNADVARAVRERPDRFAGFAFIRPGWDGPDAVRRWHAEGLRGMKATCPKEDYDSPAFYPLWAAAAELDMPVLFHTGIVTLANAKPEENISSRRMHPMMLEPIGRAFPALKMICAHLGIHWNEDAAELLRMRPNVWADITGEPGGYRRRLTPQRLRSLLWWPGALGKLVFGTDVLPEQIAGNKAHDEALLAELGADADVRQGYFEGNARTILGP